jgi:hypothetical protein
MTLVELKKFITTGIVPHEFLILIDKDNKFLARQYTKAISDLATGGVNRITSIYEPFQSSLALLTAPEDCINVLFVDTFDERAEDYSQFENTIVVCEQIDKAISKVVENFTIKLPKLEEWQILDYAKTLCPAVEEEDLLWLIRASDNNIERVINELDKVSLFDKKDQKQVFSAIRFDTNTDLNKAAFLSVSNALTYGDMPALYSLMHSNNFYELDAVGLANNILTSLKNIIIISQNPMMSAKECGVSDKQWGYIRKNYNSLNINAVKQKIKFLADFDLALKTSKLDMSKEAMMNYLVANMYYKITN